MYIYIYIYITIYTLIVHVRARPLQGFVPDEEQGLAETCETNNDNNDNIGNTHNNNNHNDNNQMRNKDLLELLLSLRYYFNLLLV